MIILTIRFCVIKIDYYVANSGLEIREYCRRGSVTLTTLHPLSTKVGTNSPTSGGITVSIVRSRPKVTEVLVYLRTRTVKLGAMNTKRTAHAIFYFGRRTEINLHLICFVGCSLRRLLFSLYFTRRV
jgi:hypothetical protein